ncbi:MAG: DUF1289 domain-containing protein [Rhizomicrobium sp.]
MIQSPCIKVCVMDPQRNICGGCGRTLDEIARWGSMTGEERSAIMRSLGTRVSSPLHGVAPPDARKMPALPGR